MNRMAKAETRGSLPCRSSGTTSSPARGSVSSTVVEKAQSHILAEAETKRPLPYRFSVTASSQSHSQFIETNRGSSALDVLTLQIDRFNARGTGAPRPRQCTAICTEEFITNGKPFLSTITISKPPVFTFKPTLPNSKEESCHADLFMY